MHNYFQNLGTPILTIGGVKGPCGIAINQKGEVVVAEAGGPCVSYSGRSFSTGKSTGLFPGSLGVAVDSVGNIIVTDSVNCCIKKLKLRNVLVWLFVMVPYFL